MIRLLPLGINGFFPSYGRQTMSFLLLTNDGPVLLDAGTGLSRLVEPSIQEYLRPYDKLHILLSHYHLDHVVGLSYLTALWRRGCIQIFAPGPPLVDAEPARALDQLLSPPLFGRHYSSFPARVELVPLSGDDLRIGALSIRLWRQVHPGGSVGFRIGDVIAYATDTAPNTASLKAVTGVRLLLHELWLADEAADDPDAAAHSHFGAVADLAKAAQVGAVMLVHHPPWREAAEIRRLTKKIERVTGIKSLLPQEGRIYELTH